MTFNKLTLRNVLLLNQIKFMDLNYDSNSEGMSEVVSDE